MPSLHYRTTYLIKNISDPVKHIIVVSNGLSDTEKWSKKETCRPKFQTLKNLEMIAACNQDLFAIKQVNLDYCSTSFEGFTNQIIFRASSD